MRDAIIIYDNVRITGIDDGFPYSDHVIFGGFSLEKHIVDWLVANDLQQNYYI